ncbi:MAG: UTP--glucose-1-phosphate uridylyltransferase GalU [Legionellaceae bacterium]|nr:UTP--glucose-1-phosphate uridylyltransferase GalU [Legionellaceae bacterium]
MDIVIRKAVFPIAGLGTRFLPATKATPKEMLPVVDKPLIQYAVEEAYEAGIRQMIFVTGRTKRAVEDHFDTAFELESELEIAAKYDLLRLVRSIKPDDMECFFVRQPRALGLGHAVLCAEKMIADEPFAVLLADDLMVGKPSILTQMVEQFHEQKVSLIAVENVPRLQTRRYGIITGSSLDNRLIDIKQIIEKPEPDAAPSTLAVAGRYILTPSIFKIIANQPSGIGGEIQLTDAIEALIQQEQVLAYRFKGHRYDCGSKLGFVQAMVDLAEKHTEIGPEVTAWLKARKCMDVVTECHEEFKNII